MDDILLPNPRLEKRILPLLDVALTIVGMLIVLLSAAAFEQSAGDSSQIVIVVDENGTFRINDKIIGSANALDYEQLGLLEDSVSQMASPQLTIHYPGSRSNLKNCGVALNALMKWCSERKIKFVPKSIEE